MKQWLQQLFSESGGVSMVRVLSLVCILTASILAFYGMHNSTHSLEAVAILCGTFLTAGMGAKVLQKRSEVSHSEKLPESVQNEDKK